MKNTNYWNNIWIAFDYGYLLPFLARLPPWIGRKLATLRGSLYARLGRDWRQFTFGDEELLGRTRQAMHELMPQADEREVTRAVNGRYIMQSLDELEACWFARTDLMEWPVEYVGLDSVLKAVADHGRIVFVTAHYSSCVIGVMLLHRIGLPVLAMTSNVTEDPRVHESISQFYRNRKSSGKPHLQGGEILDREGNTRVFVNFLKRGGAVVIFGELPPGPEEEFLTMDFLGRKRKMAAGPTRLAKLVKAPLFAFVCEHTPNGFRVTFSDPAESPYQLIDRHITRNPAAWWAADVLPMLQASDTQ